MPVCGHPRSNHSARRLRPNRFADSLTARSADTYRYIDHSDLMLGFYKRFDTLQALPCDILLSAHPDATGTLAKLEARQGGQPDAFLEDAPCREYATQAKARFDADIATQRAAQAPK